MSPAVEVRDLTTGPPGKSPQCFKRYKRVGTENSFSHHHHTPSFCMFLILLPIHNQIHELFECSFRDTLYTSKKVHIFFFFKQLGEFNTHHSYFCFSKPSNIFGRYFHNKYIKFFLLFLTAFYFSFLLMEAAHCSFCTLNHEPSAI